MRSIKEVKLGDVIQYYGDKYGTPLSDPSKFISCSFLIEATVVGIPKPNCTGSYTPVFGWTSSKQNINGVDFYFIGDKLLDFDISVRNWIEKASEYKVLQTFCNNQVNIHGIIPNKSFESTLTLHINNEDYRFFASVQKGFCPCNTTKSECRYHKDQ